MNRNLFLIGAGVGLVLVLAAAWAARRAGTLFNPVNPLNIVNQGVTGIVSAITGREETFGGWLAELFDPATRRAREMLEDAPSPADDTRYGVDIFL